MAIVVLDNCCAVTIFIINMLKCENDLFEFGLSALSAILIVTYISESVKSVIISLIIRFIQKL